MKVLPFIEKFSYNQKNLQKANVRKPLSNSRLSLAGEIGERRILDIFEDGRADVYMNEKDFPDDEIRDDWLSCLSNLSFCNFDENIVDEYTQSKRTQGSIGDLSEEEYQEFKEILNEFCGT